VRQDFTGKPVSQQAEPDDMREQYDMVPI